MSRSALGLFAVALIALSFWDINTANNAFEWIVATNQNFNGLRIAAGLSVLGFLVIPQLQNQYVSIFMRVFGALLVALALNGLYFLTYNDSRGLSMFPLDVVTILEAGIIVMIASLSVPYEYAVTNEDQEPVKDVPNWASTYHNSSENNA